MAFVTGKLVLARDGENSKGGWNQIVSIFSPSMMRWLWTIGWVLFICHLICAFAFFHHWSHASAVEHTAEQTFALTGWRWGGGVFFNYAFALLWTIDVVMWWSSGRQWPQRYPWYQLLLHSYFAFIVFNATVVFGPLFWRYIAIAVTVVALAIWWIGRKRIASG